MKTSILNFIFTLILLALPLQNINASGTNNQYRLDAGDQVKLTVFGHQDLSGEFVVSQSGYLSLPLIIAVKVVGLTLEEVVAAIISKLKPDYLLNPKVNVEVLNFRPFYIIGEVNNPGSYPYVSGMTVINAVAMAGGYTYRAKKSKTSIIRENSSNKDNKLANIDTIILPGDIIEIPERFF
jgi:polysaccharide export outer membrane protein